MPVLWTPQAPRFVGVLIFRTGRADESAIDGGLTHLIEHLALSKFDAHTRFEHNATVEGGRTIFHASGEPEEVAAFLRGVCEGLSSLPLDRVSLESRILRVEAAGRSGSVAEEMLWYRYGAQGWGVLHLPEFALERPDPTRVETWAAQRFTSGNATAWLSGPLPEGLRLELPPGPRMPSPSNQPIDGVPLPSWFTGPEGGIAATFTAVRRTWFPAVLSGIERRLRQSLRHERAISYSVEGDTMPLDAEINHAYLVATGLDEHGAEIGEVFTQTLQDVATHGLSTKELDLLVDGWDRAQRDPDAIFGWLDSTATNDLVGYESREPAELRDELASMTPESTSATTQAALSTAIVRMPGSSAHPAWLAEYPLWSVEAVKGNTFRNVRDRLWTRRFNLLRVGEDGVSIETPDGRAVTVWFDRCVALVVRPDQQFLLYGVDGFVLPLTATDWIHGDRALRYIWERVPSALRLDMSEPVWGRKSLTR